MEVSMRIRGIPGAAAIAMVWLLLPGSFRAHHAVGSEFDVKNCREFTGILTRLDWENPHTHFFVDVKDANGNVESWSFQAYSTLTMRRAGTERQELMDNIGKEVWVRGCLARSGTERKAAAGTLKFADGRLREVGQLQDDRGNR
jgi:hypothetical protein